MEVHERSPENAIFGKYFASFKDCYTKDGETLWGEFGNGDKPSIAIRNYARAISGKLLVLNAFSTGRKEIQVPELFY